MIPVIIMEGHDRAGKTTIAEELAERLGTEVFMTNSKECFTDKSIFSHDSSNISIFNYMLANYTRELVLNKMIKKPIIIYRSFLSEMVYSELLNRQTSSFHNRYADRAFSECNATIVYCKNNRKENFNDDQLNDKSILKSIEIYERVKRDIETDIFEVDTSSQDVDLYLSKIIDHVMLKGGNLK
jgi:thymidylate kinase